jgi:hypothetical protein
VEIVFWFEDEQPNDISVFRTFGNGAQPVRQENEIGILRRAVRHHNDSRQAAFMHPERERGPIHSDVVGDRE